MVESHNWSGKLKVIERSDSFIISIINNNYLNLIITKTPLRIEVINHGRKLFSESTGIEWVDNKISESFIPEDSEHFTGLDMDSLARNPELI